MSAVRIWLPVGIIVAGLLLIALVRNENGLEGGVLLIASGLSVWLLSWFYVFSFRGERDREREDAARRYFDEHGYWPDEAPAHEAERPERPTAAHKRPPGDDDAPRRRIERRPRRPSP